MRKSDTMSKHFRWTYHATKPTWLNLAMTCSVLTLLICARLYFCCITLPYLTFNFIQNVHCHRARMDMCAFVASWLWLTDTYSWRRLRRNIDQTRRMWIIRQKGEKIQLFDFIKRLQGQFETDTYQRGIGAHLCWAEVLCWSTKLPDKCITMYLSALHTF